MEKQRENFGSRAAVIMAMAGSAIGLGNIWRFPYLVGENGGAAFIIVYIICAFLLSLPIFIAESVIGRATHLGTFGAMEKLAPHTGWKWLGLLTVISTMIIISYYSVVGGWSVEYLYKSVVQGFTSSSMGQNHDIFTKFISSPWRSLICHTIFLGLCALVVTAGIKSGIERFSNITMPILFVLIILIMIYSISLPGSGAGIKYLVKPDFSKLDAQAVASAMGQSFYSLSLGVGTILTYSSYVHEKEDIMVTGLGTAIFDLMFALLAGFAIMPAVFAAGIEPNAGPGLIFETLPFIFAKMGINIPWLSYAVAILFFITILVAALTSAISMYEVGVAYLVEQKGVKRSRATIYVFLITWSLGALCALSFGPLKEFLIGGRNIFSFCDNISSNYLMTFGGLLFSVFVGWKMSKSLVKKEFTNNGELKTNEKIFGVIYFMIKYIAPITIIVIFITNLMI